jgi:hypothetical protein
MLRCNFDVVQLVEQGGDPPDACTAVGDFFRASQQTTFIFKNYLAHYVPSRAGTGPPPQSRTTLLMDDVDAWLQDEASKSMVLLGGGGTGKTSSILAVWSRLVATPSGKEQVVPLFVPLPLVEAMTGNKFGIDAAMQTLTALSAEALAYIMENHRVVLLLESLDEVRDLCCGEACCTIAHWPGWRPKWC